MIGGHASLRHVYAPINCASGCGSNNIEVIHAAVRAEHRGDALYTQAEVNQIELSYESQLEEKDEEQSGEIRAMEAEVSVLEADFATMKSELKRELAISNVFGNWPWILP